ncbi:T9SS type A sorting domain-containing protein [Candidatus Poribacteria bacterium]|nr:T9SS type A sorting domain-containing protein [Candidatus Poribacteria bacterium]
MRGLYIDNTEIAKGIFELMELPVANVDVVSVESRGNAATTFGEIKKAALLSSLHQNFPNPFNPDTWIPFALNETAEVKINIYDISSVLVREILIGKKAPGNYTSKENAIYWDGRNDVGEQVVSGVYFYTIHAGNFIATRKMLLMK